jgi:hypothetical protein
MAQKTYRFVKENSIQGDFYFTQEINEIGDILFIPNSGSIDEEKARTIYNRIIQKGTTLERTILETNTITYPSKNK